MTDAWNVLKYPALTLIVVVEFFIISSFSVKPIEISIMFWIASGFIFYIIDEMYKNHNKLRR